MGITWELGHIAYAVADLDAAMKQFQEAYDGHWADPVELNTDWKSARTGATEHVTGTAVWLVGPQPPIELWHGPAGGPFDVGSASIVQHHIGYFCPDLAGQIQRLQGLGYVVEFTPATGPDSPPTDGDFRGWAYLRHPDGSRIELQRAADKPGIERWLAGGPLRLDWSEGFFAE
ncbi:VOC family protein [Amycolatopsis jejuensis]|uniref:VOC family protein n=1 Tax=Amycolatopsis jejuensis TaxID=330084 RepID=UPI0005261D64|nr:VOC family protein [Amycolatopsis jejuensis]